jgi:DNA helicase II / ATP-dependent DNA helicase PcrA
MHNSQHEPGTIACTTNLHRAYGPPGTGKTTWLARQCLAAAERCGEHGVIVASLTRAAAEEVAGRDTGLDRRNVGTLHAHAFRALEHPALAETREGLADWNSRVPPIWQLSGDATRDPEWAAPEQVAYSGSGDPLLAQLNIIRARLGTPPTGGATPLGRFASAWSRWKAETSRLDFTDLVEQAVDVEPPRCEVFMLDEAQDMSALEMRLALAWGAHARELVIVGDPDQNLYEWRGSDPSAFTDPAAASERTLSQSYRVPAAVHAYAVEWISRVKDRPPTAYQPRLATGSVDELLSATWQQPDELLEAVNGARSNSVMLLASCAYMLQPLTRMLREARVPFHNPYRPTNGAWNPMRAAQRIRALLRPQLEDGALWRWEDLRRALEPLDARKARLARGVKTVIEGTCKEPVRLGRGTRALEDAPLGFLTSMFTEDAAALAFGAGDLDWWESCLLDRYRDSLALPLAAARAGRVAEEPAVIVGTIHSVKGGEADTVYVFPDISMAAYTGEDGSGGWGTGRRDAIVRQFYVAFTRARERLVLCGASSALSVNPPRA